jgi:hypothetical protein
MDCDQLLIKFLVLRYTKMDYQELMIAAPIAVLYPFFFAKVADYYTKRTEIDKMCEQHNCFKQFGSDYIGGRRRRSPEHQQCLDNADACRGRQSEMRDQASTPKFLILMVAGVLGIVLAGFFKTKATKVGLSLGGLMTIIMAVFMYWGKMNELMKLGVTGSSLTLLIYLSVKIYQTGSIFDALEFAIGKVDV